MKLLLLAPLLFLFSTPGLYADSGDSVIEPGRRIGQVALGSEFAAVARVLGPASRTTGGAHKGIDTWISESADRRADETSVVSGDDNSGKHLVWQVSVTSPFFRTRAGNSTKSDLDALWREFPDLRYKRYGAQGDTSRVQLYDSPDSGIAVMIQLRAHPAPGESWGQCRAILVYRPGHRPDFVNLSAALLAAP